MQVKVDRQGKEEVHVEVPVALVDALFAGAGEELNVKGALAELQKRRGDIVRGNDVTVNVPLVMALAALPDAQGRISTAEIASSLWSARFTDLVEVHEGKEHVRVSIW